MIHRSEIVSQWQDRLSAAEELAHSTARFRWIHLARVRLYRFLLACYGRGQWRTGADEAEQTPAEGVVSRYEASKWSGKPPKTVGAIQSVLKSVHNAQDRAPPVGPLVGGLDPEAYLAVTASDARIDVEKCENFLIERGFHPRVIGRGRRRTVEVPYAELKAAEALVDAHREKLRLVFQSPAERLAQQPVVADETAIVVLGLVLFAPVAGLFVMAIGTVVLQGPLNEWAGGGLFLAGFLAAAEISLLCYVIGAPRSSKWTLAARRRLAMGVFWLGIGVPAALVIAAGIVEYQSNPVVQSLVASPAAIIAVALTVIGLVALAFDWYVRR